ncbi:hypothetical protein F4821DRAFT_262353 [Hypoxylon rubiginosum]|uniref:Uncharacterized protein n=1 Tax=Hypoxylon rubiginosum TaxID=110542 RepID=A0ACC0CU48_9PEZI|nr:hypothetical protein F4821DRAFT_262353 [Hypoxylon rubiginosum]
MTVSQQQTMPNSEGLVSGCLAKELTKSWAPYPPDHWTLLNSLSPAAGHEEEKRTGTEFHLFLSLPAEIRIMIYKLCLIKGTIFLPKGVFTSDVKYKKKYTMPPQASLNARTERYRDVPKDWGALYAAKKRVGLICGVSRKIHAEAMPIFYGYNRFVFPYGHWNVPGVLRPLDPTVPPHALIRSHIRDLSVAFDARDDDDVAARGAAIFYNPPSLLDGNGNAADKQGFWAETHDLRVSRLVNAWRRPIWHCQEMPLNRLALCFRECYCPMGCCRLIDRVADELVRSNTRPSTWWFPFPREVEITGWRNEVEKELIRGTLQKTFVRSDRPVRITFVGEAFGERR